MGFVIGYYTKIVEVCLNSTRVNRFWFNIGLILTIITTIFVLYMAVYVPRILKIEYEPQVYAPRMLPLTGITTILSGICYIIGLWPVYGLFTPGLLFLFWIATLMTAHFLPAI